MASLRKGHEVEVTRPTATVVISTRDRPDQLRRCLEAVRKSVGPADEIIVVDSASQAPEIVRDIALSAGARFLRCEQPGASRARNLGIAHSTGEIIAFTDDDALVDTGWLDALLSPFADADTGAVVGPIFELGSDPPRLLIRYPLFDAARERVVFRKRDADWFERLRLGAIGSGANFAARRELFDRNGLFRECLGAGAPIPGDEIFFFFSIVASGETVVNEPSARVFHPALLDDRYEQISESRFAYWVYASLNWPQMLPRVLLSLARRRVSGRARIPNKLDRPATGLVRAMLRTPALFISAWRFSRWR